MTRWSGPWLGGTGSAIERAIVSQNSSFAYVLVDNLEMPVNPCWSVFDPVPGIDLPKNSGIFLTYADQSPILQSSPKNEFSIEFD